MHIIKIKRNTSIDDVLDWMQNAQNAKAMTFEILSDASFQLLAEGVALGVLRRIAVEKIKIRIQFFSTSTPRLIKFKKPIKVYPIFRSIFGLELLRLSQIEVEGEEHFEGKEYFKDVLNHIWKGAVAQEGLLDDGKMIYLPSRYNYKVPKRLRAKEGADNFPGMDQFKKNASHLIECLRGSHNRVTPDEFTLIEFLYHIAENAYLHGREPTKTHAAIRGFSGIVFFKYIFNWKGEVEKRRNRDIPDFVMEAVDRQRAKSRNDRSALFNGFTIHCVSVIDIGDGIHNTLDTTGYQDIFDKLGYVFGDGISRLVGSHDPRGYGSEAKKTGYGLGTALIEASKLDAFLHIVSGNIEVSVDCSYKSTREFILNLSADKQDQSKSVSPRPSDLFSYRCNHKEKIQYGSSVSCIWSVQSDKNSAGSAGG